MKEVFVRVNEAVRSGNLNILKFSAYSIFRKFRYPGKNKIGKKCPDIRFCFFITLDARCHKVRNDFWNFQQGPFALVILLQSMISIKKKQHF